MMKIYFYYIAAAMLSYFVSGNPVAEEKNSKYSLRGKQGRALWFDSIGIVGDGPKKSNQFKICIKNKCYRTEGIKVETFYAKEDGGGAWDSTGYWYLDPGEVQCVAESDCPHIYFRAMSYDGNIKWSGSESTYSFDEDGNAFFTHNLIGKTMPDSSRGSKYTEGFTCNN
mmetsp:Transcript_34478/g.75462  ORF Transcript_34478/g.75462 Transcript_34478/m.75462 type:complete len:169 (+) Transcript_34478:201-707(+)|eukprot:CAMPEP_0178512234 /NCGR_PEP_ID=MMETSP0696-20121128/22783_1 /TAXON_ID=265572 /ORGANISM="Extubocellulus spinifer, Strain CCMP396" /LENGTH=168 /DNA_ID=CAMNT_0020142053 /DNA_START=139 /DNA_END=645 /DNA_ORIENTATION=-